MQDRIGTRLPFQIQVDYRIDEDSDVLFTTDISEHGLFLETVNPYPVGTKLALRFNLPGIIPTIHVVGEVMRVVVEVVETDDQDEWHVPGMGVRFMSIDRHDRKAIRAFIRRATGTGGN